MAERKQKKGFSFTIDSLINSTNDDHSRKAHSNAVISKLPEAIMSPSISEFKYNWRADDEFSEYSDCSDRISPSLTRDSYFDNLGDDHRESAEDVEMRCSTSFSDPPTKPRSSSPSYRESGPDKTNSRHKKKSRTAFTNEQLDQLEKRFHSQRYLAPYERSDFAEELKLTDQQVKTWFQNRRMKEKRQLKMKQTSNIPFPTGGVDVLQLRACGIPCPLPPCHVTAPSYSSQALPPSLPYSANILSQPSSPYLPSLGQVHPRSLPYLPHYGHQYGFNQPSVPYNAAVYAVL